MAKKSSSSSMPPVKSRIKRPGALSKKKKKGESTLQAARRIKNSPSASPLAKQQANFYLNVLRKGSQTQSKKKKRGKK